MARRIAVAPARNDVYTGMLAVSLVAVLIGIVTLALELSSDYSWEMEAKGGPTISLPAKDAPAGNVNVAPAGGAKADPLPGEPKVETAKVVEPAAEAPAKLPTITPPPVLPEIKTTPVPAPAVATPAPSRSPVPSPFKLPGQ